MYRYKLLFFIFCMSTWASAKSSTPIPKNIVALGDSSTAGMLSAHSRDGIWFPLRHIPVLIDSIEMLFTFNKGAYEKRSNSWSTGKRIRSHYRLLKELNPDIQAANLSVSSSFAKDIWEKEIPSLIEWSRKNNQVPEYVTLLVGANDLCAESLDKTTTVSSFNDSVAKSLDFLMSASAKTKVMVLPLIRLDLLEENVGDAFVLPAPKMSTCHQIWDMIPLCQSVTGAVNSADRERLKNKVDDFNQVFKSNVDRLRRKYGDRIRISWEHRNIEPQKEYVAVDCFHPNKKAQEDYSLSTWKNTWWSGK